MKKIIALGVIIVLISITIMTSAQRFGDPSHGKIPPPLYEPNPQYAMYMKIEGIEGESTDVDHIKWIDILSYEFGGEKEIDESTRQPTGNRIYHPLVIRKFVDKASPKLANHTHIDSFFDVFIEIDGEHGTFMKYKFSNARISSYFVEGIPALGKSRPMETITFNYEGVKTVYTQYDKRGRIISIEESEWPVSVST